MNKIIFDLMVSQPVAGSKFHGGGEYTKTIFRELCIRYDGQIELVAFYDDSRFIDDWVLQLIADHNVKLHCVRTYEEVSTLEDFRTADIFVACLLTGVEKVKKPAGMKVIGVYHGFRVLEKPIDSMALLYEDNMFCAVKTLMKILGEKYYYRWKYRQIQAKINACTEIIGVSNHAGYSARTLFPDYDKSRMYVFYPPEKYVERIPEVSNLQNRKFILMLGGNRWIKNSGRGMWALDRMFSQGLLKQYNVTVIGGIPRRIKKALIHREKFIETDYLSAQELERMYMMCDVFFYPTLNEGFGSPPLEALKYGKTCVVSAVSSLTEIYKDAVYYCNPYDIREMQARLLQASEEKILQDIIKKTYLRIHKKQQEDLEKLCRLIVGEI